MVEKSSACSATCYHFIKLNQNVNESFVHRTILVVYTTFYIFYQHKLKLNATCYV